MSPEMLRSQGVDRRSDIYAAAVVLWEALTGRRLFEGQGPAMVAQAVLEAPVWPPSKINTQIPSVLDQVIMRGLSRDRNARFATARDMALELERAVVPAPNALVNQWVERIARKTLDERARWISEIESFSVSSPPPPEVSESLPRSVNPAPSSRSTVVPADYQVTVVPALLKPRRRSGALAAVLVLGALAIAGVALGGVTFMRSRAAIEQPEPAPPPAAAPTPEQFVQKAAPPSVAEAIPSAAPAAEPEIPEPAPSASVSAKPAPTKPAPAASPAQKPAPKPATRKPSDGFGDLTRF
jgi:serine/threonine-protein kinase